jgi:hypothetical protein
MSDDIQENRKEDTKDREPETTPTTTLTPDETDQRENPFHSQPVEAGPNSAVENPKNDPTTNDTTQSADERLADAKATAVVNHVAEHGPLNESSDEEEVA